MNEETRHIDWRDGNPRHLGEFDPAASPTEAAKLHREEINASPVEQAHEQVLQTPPHVEAQRRLGIRSERGR
jgi:hypothetical protein